MTDVNDDVQSVVDDLRARSEVPGQTRATDAVCGVSTRYYLQYKIEGSRWYRYGVGFDDGKYARQMLAVHKRDAEKDKSGIVAPVKRISWRLIIEKIEWRVIEDESDLS
jgi:hypothetical protein